MIFTNLTFQGNRKPKKDSEVSSLFIEKYDRLQDCMVRNCIVIFGNTFIRGNILEKCKGDTNDLDLAFDSRKPADGAMTNNFFYKCFFRKIKPKAQEEK